MNIARRACRSRSDSRPRRRRRRTQTTAPAAWPAKPIRMIVTFPPGGSTDATVRIVAPKLGERLGQQVVVDNRPGAGGNIGLAALAKSDADGYTLGVGAAGGLAANAALYPKMPFDAQKDFVPISLLAHIPFVLVVAADVADQERRRPARAGEGRAGQGRGRPRRQRHGDAPVGAAAEADGAGRPHRDRLQGLGPGRARRHRRPGAGRHARPAVGAAADQGRQGARARRHRQRAACRSCPTCRRSPRRASGATSRPAGSASSRRRRRRRRSSRGCRPRCAPSSPIPRSIAGARAAGVELSPTTSAEFGRFIASETVKWADVIKRSGTKLE